MKFSVAPHLDGLAALARKDGLDMRAVLVRVLTDLYIQAPAHTAEEQRHYGDLALRYIEAADVSTRSVVARKLAAYAGAPSGIVIRLARDVIDVAEPILRQSPVLSRSDLEAIAKDCGPEHASIVRERLNTARPDAPASAAQAQKESALAHGAPKTRVSERARDSGSPRADPDQLTGAPPPVDAGDIGARFLSADGPTRRAMLAALQAPEIAPRSPITKSEDSVRRMELAALRRNADEFARELQRLLAISRIAAETIARDESGEALVVALRALELPSSLVLRILLFLNPRIGDHVDRVFELTQLYQGIELTSAMRIVTSLQQHEDAPRPVQYRPSFAPDPTPRGARELLTAISESLSDRAAPTTRSGLASRASKGQETS